MFAKPLKRVCIKRHHVTRVLLWIGIIGMGLDALAALGVFQNAEHLMHLSGAGGATLAGLADAFGTAAKAEV